MAASRSASNRKVPFRDLLLRTDQRPLLARPMGPVLPPEKAQLELAHRKNISTCGDVVTATLLRWGITPFAAVVDGRTQRDHPVAMDSFRTLLGSGPLRATNPAGELTADLQEKVRELVQRGGGLLIVEGEEDLAVLPMARELPTGATLLYGQPGEGLCFLTLDAKVKRSVQRILEGMEARPA